MATFFQRLSPAVLLSHDFVFFLRHLYTGKGPFWATQSQEGAEKKCYDCTQLAPAAFLRNTRDLKDKVATEGMAGIFNDLPRAPSQSSSLISQH